MRNKNARSNEARPSERSSLIQKLQPKPFDRNAWVELLVQEEGYVQRDLDAVWDRCLRWTEVGRKMRNTLEFWRRVNLALNICGAFLAVVKSQVSEWRWIVGLVSAISLALVPAISGSFLSQQKNDESIRVKLIADKMTSEFYLYLTNAGPYQHPAICFQSLLKTMREIESDVDDLRVFYVLENPNDKSEKHAGLPKVIHSSENGPRISRRDYVRHRINAVYMQSRKKAQMFARKSSHLAFFQYVLGGAAALLPTISSSAGELAITDVNTSNKQFVSFASVHLAAYAAVLSTASSSVSSFKEMSKFQELATIYSETAQNLEDAFLATQNQGFLTEEEEEKDESGELWREFVLECEEILNKRNLKWSGIVKKTKKEKRTPTASLLGNSSKDLNPTASAPNAATPITSNQKTFEAA